MTKEEVRQFGLNLLHGIVERNKVSDPCYADNVKQAIDALSAPSLPSNLDEAAEKYEHNLGYYECMNQWPSVAFKAGAEWMAEQGVSYETEVGWIDGPTVLNWPEDILDGFKMGDKVIVQIRKK